MQRTVFALPKMTGKARGTLTEEEEKKQMMDIFSELDSIRKKNYSHITKWKCKPVTRKYAFEMPIPHGEHKFLKIKYDATMPTINPNLTGNTFECLFGANQSMLELFILKAKIKGPCWMTVRNVQKATDFKKTWCRHEINISSPSDIVITIDDLNRESPALSALTFSFKTTRSQYNTNEIAMISCIIHPKLHQDGPSPNEGIQRFTLVRKLDSKPMPFDFERRLKQLKDNNL
jgi:DNA polymerase alpha subunit A